MKPQARHCVNVLLKALQESDLTYKEMGDISGFSYFWLVKLIKQLKREKVLHVCGYYKDVNGKETIKIFRYGKGRDAKRFKLTGTEKQRNYLRRKQQVIIPTSLIQRVSL